MVVEATPATTGTRPFAAPTTTSTTRRRCARERYANSPVDPRGVSPCTPLATRSSQRRASTSAFTSPAASIGETRYGKTPRKAASAISASGLVRRREVELHAVAGRILQEDLRLPRARDF